MTDSLISPEDFETFRREIWTRKAVRIRGSPSKFDGLFGWDSLNRVLNTYPPPHPSMKLTKGGNPVPGRDAIEIIRQTQKGATLIIDDIDRLDPGLGRFLDEFADEINEQVRINMYLSYPAEKGFLLHYDTQDFFILQIAGMKKWKVYPPTISSPLFFQKTHGKEPPPAESMYLECTLKPGDVLYCPRGHWHEALAEREPSMHLTLGIFVATGIDFLSWIVEELRDEALFRENFPLLLKNERVGGNGDSPISVEEHVNLVKARLIQRLQEKGLCSSFYEARVAGQRNRNPFNFPHHLSRQSSDYVSVTHFRRLPHATQIVADRTKDRVRLVFAGRQMVLESCVEKLLRIILSRVEFSKAELVSLCPELSWEQILQVLHALMKEGLVAPK